MKNVSFLMILAIFAVGCSENAAVNNLPAMNDYSEEQNAVLERFEWLGFDPSILRTERITEDLAVVFGYGGNVLVSVGEDGVLIVDSQFPEVHGALLSEISKLGGDSVDYVISTHFHFDHAEGNRAFGPLGADIIAHKNSMAYFEEGANIDMVSLVWPQQPYEKEALPKLTYSEEMALNFNGHTIEIRNYGPAHTSGDSFIYFRESNVIHMGDVANLTGLPFIDAGNGGSVDGMIYSVKKVLSVIDENTVVVPGHGEISRKEDLEVYVAKMELVRNRVASMIEEGLSHEEVLELDPGAEIFPSSAFDSGFGIPPSQVFVDRAYVSMKKMKNNGR